MRGLEIQQAGWQTQLEHTGAPVGNVEESVEVLLHPRVLVAPEVSLRVVIDEARRRYAGAC
jgi:hypothetical protein